MTIKIAYLYYDLMNLYGERGNVIALKNNLENNGVTTELYELSIEDEIDFNLYDIYIIGSGTENNQKIVSKHILKYKEDIEEAIENDKFFLVTGNAIELFGRNIKCLDGDMIDCLGIFDYEAERQSERLVGQVVFDCSLINKTILGFQNQGSVIKNYNFNLFEVIKGIGSYDGSKNEGIYYKNYFGTYVIGPLLVRNPEFLEYITKKIINSKDESFVFDPFNSNLEFDKKAYNTFMKNYYPSYIK